MLSFTFSLIRHGQTDWNVQGLVQGHTDIPLNEEGKRQAFELAQQLRSCSYSAIFASDLSRARETAEIIAAFHGLPVQLSPQLRERCYGTYEGSPWSSVPKDNVTWWEWATPDGESQKEVEQRVLNFLHLAANQHLHQEVLMVAHGGIVHTLFALANYELYGKVTVSNTACVRFQYESGKLSVLETRGVIEKAVQPGSL